MNNGNGVTNNESTNAGVNAVVGRITCVQT